MILIQELNWMMIEHSIWTSRQSFVAVITSACLLWLDFVIAHFYSARQRQILLRKTSFHFSNIWQSLTIDEQMNSL